MDELSIKWDAISRRFGDCKSTFHCIELSIINAIHFYTVHQIDEALAALQDAMDETEKEGILRVYLDEGEPMLELLRIAKLRGIAPHYTKKLIHAFSLAKKGLSASIPDVSYETLVPSENSTNPKELCEPLSKRELEILQLLRSGFSNREISEKLVISLSTVKNHTSNIYQKLEVNSRGKAIKRAVELGYL